MSRHNPWKGFVLGMVGSLAGLAAMNLYKQRVAPRVNEITGERLDRWGEGEMVQRYQDISIYGQQYEENQSPGEVLGRRIYQRLTGSEPRSKEGVQMAANLTHYGTRMLMGGLYGAMQGKNHVLDLRTGLLFGAILWLYGEEIVVPLLGLKAGPTQAPPQHHLDRLGTNIAFGLGTAIASQTLKRMI
jgi:hypothetical protein